YILDLGPENSLIRHLLERGHQVFLMSWRNFTQASDMQEGKLRQCDLGDFEVGVNLATTPGAVVLETPLFQLTQYSPLSETQYQRPVFIVPPAINKYYILDLGPENSLIRHLLERGHQVFLMSWRNFTQ
ncbi:hypothetical protein ED855_19755, partial [Acinetobacter baumannii]